MHNGWVGFYILKQIMFWLRVLIRRDSASDKEGLYFQKLLIRYLQHASHLAGIVDSMMCEKHDPWFPKHINKNSVILLIQFSQQEVTLPLIDALRLQVKAERCVSVCVRYKRVNPGPVPGYYTLNHWAILPAQKQKDFGLINYDIQQD